jgi:hypothetical protein
MRQQRVLGQPAWPALLGLALGVGWLLLDFTFGPVSLRTLFGVGLVVLSLTLLVTRHTVLDEQGIKLAGSLRRHIKWADIVAVRQSKMALHYQNVELLAPVFQDECDGLIIDGG